MSEERQKIIAYINEAQACGARQSKACQVIGISAKTLQRWRQSDILQDGRLKFKEYWQWLSGDMSSGYSEIIEIDNV